MKKVRIVTYIRAYNYGAVLQCYALSKCLNDMGANCDVLDYYPEVFRDTYKMKAHPTLRHPRVGYLLKRISILKTLIIRNNNFKKFISKNIPLSKKQYISIEQLKNYQSDVDCYIAGSDQVWSHVWSKFDPVFFLDFPDAIRKKRYSYAASFGFVSFPEEFRSDFFRRLKGYSQYSVREYSALSLVEEATGIEARVDCDPTLLLKTEIWESMVGDRLIPEKYILLYYTSKSDLLHKKAEMLRRVTGYKVIALPCLMDLSVLSGKYEKSYGNGTLASASPEDFLNLFKYAEYVLTNTFHGTIFSIIFHKKFVTQMIGHDGKLNYRVQDLFSMLGIVDRTLENDFENIDSELSWGIIDSNINDVRKSSVEYLYRIIHG